MSNPYRSGRGGDQGRTCPRCTDTTLVIAYGNQVEACPACGGLFVDRDRIDELLFRDTTKLRELAHEARVAPPRPRTLPVVLACPACRGSMARVEVEGACVVDACRAHGVWFDRWEVELVADAIRDEAIAARLRDKLR